jgi:hypothetical protein
MADVAIANGGELRALDDKRFVKGGAARRIHRRDFGTSRPEKKAAHDEDKHEKSAKKETRYPH